jgi:hypothetical protein
MQNFLKIMLMWLLQDVLFALAALLLVVTVYRIRFVWKGTMASYSFVCMQKIVVYQSVEVEASTRLSRYLQISLCDPGAGPVRRPCLPSGYRPFYIRLQVF